MTYFFISPPFGNYLDLEKTISIKGSFTLYPRTRFTLGSGLITRILLSLRYNFQREGWVNKIGLRNPGIEYAVEKYENRKDCIVSVAILDYSEIPRLVTKIPPSMNLELNVSCPNVTQENTDLIIEAMPYFLNEERKWCIVKLSPTTDMKLVDSYYKQGFRQFHCSNTIPLEDGTGGLSGKCIMNYNRKLIPAIKERYPDTTIIAGGGITKTEDVKTYENFGADFYSFSTVLFNPFKAYILYKNL